MRKAFYYHSHLHFHVFEHEARTQAGRPWQKKKQVLNTVCLTKHEKKAFKIHVLSSLMNLLWGFPDLSLRLI